MDVNVISVYVAVSVDVLAVVSDYIAALPAGSLVARHTLHAGVVGMTARDAPPILSQSSLQRNDHTR